MRRTDYWPESNGRTRSPRRYAVVCVNYNTRDHTALLLWSLHRILDPAPVRIVVVDNGSTDGSVGVLRACAQAGLCDLVPNSSNVHHGPGLNHGLSRLARLRKSGLLPSTWVWLLDSDVVVARPDAGVDAMAAARAGRAAIVGEAKWEAWYGSDRFGAYSFFFDPARAWRRDIGRFPDDGDPVHAFERSALSRGVRAVDFPFAAAGYVIHRGRGTLARMYQRRDTSNRFWSWAKQRHDPHFELVEGAERRYAELRDQFATEVGRVTPRRLVGALT